MTGVIRKATLLVALGLLAATVAMAGIPSAAHSIISKTPPPTVPIVPLPAPAFIDVVATDGTSADVFGTFYVYVRDIGDFPVTNCQVVVDFTGANDIELCTNGTEPAGQVNTLKTATVTTGTNGVAAFTIAGGALDLGGLATGPGLDAVTITACGYLLANVSAAAYDLNGKAVGGSPGVTSLDASVLSTDNGLFGGPGNPGFQARCDFTHDGFISSLDASYASTLRGYGTSAVGCP